MGIDTMADILGKYGIGALVIVVLCVISFLIIKHILTQSDKILDSAMQVNEKWQKAIDEHTAQAREFSTAVNTAHEFQRKEHEKMIANLDEQAKILVRINGYKS